MEYNIEEINVCNEQIFNDKEATNQVLMQELSITNK